MTKKICLLVVVVLSVVCFTSVSANPPKVPTTPVAYDHPWGGDEQQAVAAPTAWDVAKLSLSLLPYTVGVY